MYEQCNEYCSQCFKQLKLLKLKFLGSKLNISFVQNNYIHGNFIIISPVNTFIFSGIFQMPFMIAPSSSVQTRDGALSGKGKRHQCPQCELRFVRKDQLREHVANHSGIKEYSCPHCSYKSNRRWNMKIHVTNRHGPRS